MRIFLFILLLLTGVAMVGYLYQEDILPVKQIQIDGEVEHIDLHAVEQTLLPFVQNGLLSVDVTALQQALVTIPWVAQVRVSRMWPDTVHVWLSEPHAVALWADSGVVSQDGQVYYLPPHSQLPHLPVFEGLEGESPMMLDYYQHMQVILDPYQLKIERLVLSPRQAWEVQLDNGMVVRLGQQDILERLQRLMSVYPQLTAKSTEPIEYVDLRYPNGFAVKLRQENTVTNL